MCFWLSISDSTLRRQSGLKSGVVHPSRKNFNFWVNFTKKSVFQTKISEWPLFPFKQSKLAIYSYFWAYYYISIQKSPLSNILPVHDTIIIIFHDPSTTPMTPCDPPHDLHSPNSGGPTPPSPQIDACDSTCSTLSTVRAATSDWRWKDAVHRSLKGKHSIIVNQIEVYMKIP